MSYCTVAQLREALAPGVWEDVTEPPTTQTAADLPDSQLQDALDEASSIVDTAIGGRYVTPVAATSATDPPTYPHPVDFWARNIAAYLATCTYRGSSDFTDNDPIYRRYKTTLDSLNDVKNGVGVVDLPKVTDPAKASAGAGTVINPYSGKLFTADDFDLVPATHPPGVPRVTWDWP